MSDPKRHLVFAGVRFRRFAMHRSCLFPLMFLAVSAVAAAGQLDRQPEVTVTASRVVQTIDSVLADVSVITRADIEASAARDVLEILRMQSGIDLYRTGGAGSQTSLFLRGSNANHVLVLLDGVRIASLNTGAFAFEQLPIDAIERIEIVRGPRASYWGSDAIGGVIQVFTRRLHGSRVAFGYGSHGDAHGSAGFGHWNGAGDGLSVQVGLRHVDGYSSTNPNLCNGPDDPYCSYNPDDNPYRNANLAARGAHAFGSQQLSATLLRSDSRSSFDQDFATQGHSDVLEQAIGVNLEGPLGAGWEHRLSVGDAREDLLTPAYVTHNTSRRRTLGWQHRIQLDARQAVVAGIDLLRERGASRDSTSGIANYADTRTNRALYAGWQGRFGRFDGELSARRDDNSEFGGASTGSIAFGWRFGPRVRVWTSYGRGFRSPTLNEQFSPGFGGFFAGNPDLDPERSRSAELGIDFEAATDQHFALDAYQTRVHDLIAFTGEQNRAQNVANARIDGVEANWDGVFGAWRGRAALTWQNPRDADNDTPLLRRPKRKFSTSLERSFGSRMRAGIEVLASGRRQDIADVELPGYLLVNLRGSAQLTPDWRLDLRVENLADRAYELARGFNTPGRSAYVDLVWEPR
jgi:vitamin B12 transporter